MPANGDDEQKSSCTDGDLKPKIQGDETTYNTIFIGKTLFIFCAFDACDSPATVTWFKDTTRLEFDEQKVSTSDARLKLMKNGSLIIENVQEKDTGVKYVCSVQNEHGRDTASAFVDVKSKSRILSQSNDVQFQEGTDVTFNCSFEIDNSWKDTAVVEWYKDNKKINLYHSQTPTINCEYCDLAEDNSEASRIILHQNQSITIEHIKDEDVGSYSCQVQTGFGEPLVLEAGTLYAKSSWWWIVIVVLIIIGFLLLCAYLVMRYVKHLQKSGKYDIKSTKRSSKKETFHEPIVLHL